MKVLENVGVGTELTKRFYLDDVVITKECSCGAVMEKDLSSDYLSYPMVGYPENIYFYCDECGTEYEDAVKVTVIINLLVEE